MRRALVVLVVPLWLGCPSPSVGALDSGEPPMGNDAGPDGGTSERDAGPGSDGGPGADGGSTDAGTDAGRPLPPIYTGGAILSCELGGGLPIADTFARAQTSSAGVAC